MDKWKKDSGSVCGYRILKILGKGGQGTVYLAEHEALHKKYAIKYAAGEGRAQLRREAEIMKGLTDRRIPYLVDLIDTADHTVLVMEYVEGVSLQAYLEERVPMEEEEALELFGKITDIVAYLHKQNGIVAHRDLKPANFVLARDGSVHLLDFGTALCGIESLRRKDLCGTPGYAAPEQMQKSRSGTEADVYALGALYSFMLTGADPALPPFHPAGYEECPEEISGESRMILKMALQTIPEKRPQDAVGMLELIGRVKKRKRRIFSLVESMAYRIALGSDVCLLCMLVWLRCQEYPCIPMEKAGAVYTVVLMVWYALRSCFGKERFVIRREWNVTYTAKQMWGL